MCARVTLPTAFFTTKVFLFYNVLTLVQYLW
jgi:hypothetical protein